VPDDRHQPSAEVVDSSGISAAQSQPCFLHRIVYFAQRTEHPVRQRAQARAMLFESVSEILASVHRSHFLIAFRHTTDG